MINSTDFFPVRYEKSRPFIKQFLELCRNKTTQEVFEDTFQMKIQNLLFNEMVRVEQTFPPDVYVDEKGFNFLLSRELNFFWFYHKWQNSGRNIFHFSKALIELFENTDVDQIPLEAIQFPFKTFYISFRDLDRQFAIDTAGNEYFIDGAFIIKDFVKSNQIDLFFNGVDKKAEPTKNWLWGNYASLTGDWFRINFSSEKNTLRKAGYLPKFIKDYPEEGKDATRMFFENMVNITFNALCYLSSKQEEVPDIQYPKDTPSHLLSKLEKAKTKHQKEIVQSEIKRSGFTKINFLGQSFKRFEATDNKNKLIAPHWRRGFWRNQPFGQGLKDHKLIWIKPTIVNKDKGSPATGHIYHVIE